MRCNGRDIKRKPPKFGKWVDCEDHFPPVGQPVLGWFGGTDIETVMVNCRGSGKREDDWWWETRAGDTAEPAAWAEIKVDLLDLAGLDSSKEDE